MLKKLSLEFYVLFVPSVLICLSLISFGAPFRDILYGHLFKDSVSEIVFSDDNIIYYIIIVVILYIAAKGANQFIFGLRNNFTSVLFPKDEIIKFLRSTLYFFTILFVSGLTLGTLLVQTFQTVSLNSIIKATDFVVAVEQSIFGSILAFSIHGFHIPGLLERVIILDYITLSYVTAIVIAILFAFNFQLFRKSITALFVATIISTLVWNIAPILAPVAMYRFNILNLPMERTIKEQVLNYAPSEYLLRNMRLIEMSFFDPTYEKMAVSSIPSMHAILAVLIAFYGTLLLRWLGLFLWPWALINIYGAVYVEQHYGVDVLLGIFIAIICIYIVQKLFYVEEKYFRDKYDLFYAENVINRDFHGLGKWCYNAVVKSLVQLRGHYPFREIL